MRKLPFKIMGDYICVKADEKKEQSEAGLFIPSIAQPRPDTGVIMGVGDGRIIEGAKDFLPYTVKIGDKVLYHPFSGQKEIIDGVEYIFMLEDDLIAIMEEKDAE